MEQGPNGSEVAVIDLTLTLEDKIRKDLAGAAGVILAQNKSIDGLVLRLPKTVCGLSVSVKFE